MYIGAIWVNKSKQGLPYLSIIMRNPKNEKEEWKMVAFKNKKFVEGGTQPKYSMYFDDPNEQKGGPQRGSYNNQRSAPPKQNDFEDDINVDDIPF